MGPRSRAQPAASILFRCVAGDAPRCLRDPDRARDVPLELIPPLPEDRRRFLEPLASGVTSGDLLKGVRYKRDFAQTESIVMRSSGIIRRIETVHMA